MLQHQFLLKAILNKINLELNLFCFTATTAKARSSLDFVLQTSSVSLPDEQKIFKLINADPYMEMSVHPLFWRAFV